MIKIAVVEDDERYVSKLLQYLETYQKEENEDFLIKVYRDGDDIAANYKAQYHIILMDIQMKFVDGMTAAKEIRKNDSDVISVKGGVKREYISNIYYIESKGHNLVYHTKNGMFLSNGTLKNVEELLNGMHFSRGNSGYLINLEHVEAIENKCVIVKGEHLLLSRTRRNSFMQELTKYWAEMR